MKINFCSAPCGSGKTRQSINRGCKWAKTGRRIIYVQHTKELIDKTVQEELLRRPDAPTYKVFHGDTVSGSVAHNLTEYLKQMMTKGKSFSRPIRCFLTYGFGRTKTRGMSCVDEAPQVHRHNSYKVPDTHRLITDLISLEPYNSVYSVVEVADEDAMEQIARNEDHDEIYEEFRELSQTLLNQHWASFVDTEKFEKLKAGKHDTVVSPFCFDAVGTGGL